MLRPTILLLLTALVSFGAPSNCASGSLSDYLALSSDGCQLGTRVLSDFSLEDLLSFATPIDPTDVQVTPSAAGPIGSLLFTFNTSAATAELFQSALQFTVAPNSPEKVDLQLIGATATADGATTGVADLCSDVFLGGVCFGLPQPVLITLVTESANIPLASGSIGPLASYHVRQDIVVDGGPSGTAALQSSQLTFTAIPEPSTLATLGAGLALTFVLRRRRRNQ